MVLLIEDNMADVRLMQEGLKDFNVVLHVETDGESAIEYLKNHRPQLVILDLNLTRINGREVLKFIKSSPELCFIPVLIYSTSDDIEDILFCYLNGANAYITKPFSLRDFLDLLKSLGEFWFKKVKFI